MIGKLLILETEKNIGKILFEDGRESSTRVFPSTYESGDRIFVKFLDDDPEKKILDMHVENEERYFGSALIPTNERRYRSIIVNYPVLYGLVEYKPSDLSFEITGKSSNVSFNIRKNKDGRLSAINIQRANKSDYYKCISPDFGHLIEGKDLIKVGLVQSVDPIICEKDIFKGTIERVETKDKGLKSERSFGTIYTTRRESVYFNAKQFFAAYMKAPSEGDVVLFTIFDNRDNHDLRSRIWLKSSSVKQFLKPDFTLTTVNNNRRVIIDLGNESSYIQYKNYLNLYETEPAEGNLVSYFKDPATKKIRFLRNNKTALNNYMFMCSTKRYLCNVGNFINFQYPHPGDLFLTYMDNTNIKEVYKADLTSLPIAISFYKKVKSETNHRLQAIDTLINRNYEDTRITQIDLKKERVTLLKSLLSNAIDSGLTAEAEEYQYRLQMLDYSPKNLYRTNPNENAIPYIFKKISVKEYYDDTCKWRILNTINNTVYHPAETEWKIIMDVNKNEQYHHNEEAWHINLKSLPSVKFRPIKTFLNIFKRGK